MRTERPNVLDFLRLRTQRKHKQAEQRLNIMDENLTRTRYVEILRQFHGFYSKLNERWQNEKPEIGWVPDFASKLSLLEKDLFALGEPLPQKPNQQNLAPLGLSWWGVLYVSEGSNLGSQMIHKHLQTTMPEWKEALSFYLGQASDTGPRWMRFLGQLNNAALAGHEEALSTAAENTFDDVCVS